MQIGKDWKIESDELNVTLFKRHPAGGKSFKTGKVSTQDTWAVHTYYSNVGNALKALVDQEIRNTELKDLETVLAKIEELHTLIESLNSPK